jgi:hypothetical protein
MYTPFTFFGTPEPPRLGAPPPPLNLGPIREDINEELDRIRTRLRRLENQNGDTKKSRWLEMRIAVLRARLQYPTDEVLQQLEQTVESRKKLNRKKEQKFLDQLNARLAQLEGF